jgi:hypothetical protein
VTDAEVEEFHFIDLLGLHFRAQLDLPFGETRGLLALMHHLSGLHLLPSPALFPWPLVEIMREDVHEQHRWLAALRTPPFVHPERNWADWAVFWAWADKAQARACASLGVAPDGFPVRRSQRITATFIVIEPDEG